MVIINLYLLFQSEDKFILKKYFITCLLKKSIYFMLSQLEIICF